MTTLREILDERMKPCPCAAIIESWAYGQDGEPGLVERLGHQHSAECWSNYNDPTTPTCGQPEVSVLDALREELGVEP